MDLNLDIEQIDFREHMNYETAQFTERDGNGGIINLQTYMHSNRKRVREITGHSQVKKKLWII